MRCNAQTFAMKIKFEIFQNFTHPLFVLIEQINTKILSHLYSGQDLYSDSDSLFQVFAHSNPQLNNDS